MRPTVFKTAAFNRSAIPPAWSLYPPPELTNTGPRFSGRHLFLFLPVGSLQAGLIARPVSVEARVPEPALASYRLLE